MNTILSALTEDLPATQPETQAPILLRRGQVGTVMMAFDGEAFLVDFSAWWRPNLRDGNYSVLKTHAVVL